MFETRSHSTSLQTFAGAKYHSIEFAAVQLPQGFELPPARISIFKWDQCYKRLQTSSNLFCSCSLTPSAFKALMNFTSDTCGSQSALTNRLYCDKPLRSHFQLSTLWPSSIHNASCLLLAVYHPTLVQPTLTLETMWIIGRHNLGLLLYLFFAHKLSASA